jgi:aldose 1-epimerase
MQRIASRAFGVTEKAGVITQATLYTMRNANGVTASITDFGATLQSLMLPDASGAMADCVLGFDDVSGYAADDTPYFGCIVGRVANRIAKGKFSLGGTEYTLAINNEPNTLHGGPAGYNKQLWKATPIDAPGAPPAVALTLQDPDGHEGYPGDVSVSVTYTLTDENELKIDMTATTSAPTPLNLANHSYFNLDGSGSGDILNTKVKMSCETMTPMDDTSIPTGEIVPVEGTPFDFTSEQTIGARIKDITCPSAGGGYDHNMVVKADGWGKLSRESPLSSAFRHPSAAAGPCRCRYQLPPAAAARTSAMLCNTASQPARALPYNLVLLHSLLIPIGLHLFACRRCDVHRRRWAADDAAG